LSLKFVFGLIAGLLVASFVTLVYIITQSTYKELVITPTPIYTPTFQRGDCFKLSGQEEEVWDTLPDGIVERVGKHNYLILWKNQAEKRGGTKYGSTIEIKVFDELNSKVVCPPAWRNHNRAK